MTAPAAPLERPALRLTRQSVAMLGVAALAWAGVIAYARDMRNGSGTMGMRLVEFLPMWSLMMTAMMLPAVGPVASLYLRTINSNRAHRVILFVVGYLFVWSAVGVPAYLALRIVDDHVTGTGSSMLALAAVVVSVRHGETIGRLAGAGFIVLALLVAASPRVADAVVPSTPPDSAGMTGV